MTERPTPQIETIGQLIDVPPVKTVVQLGDLKNREQRSSLAENFVFTEEVLAHLRRILTAVSASRGFAGFLRGHYGSGKSHFLAFLQLLLSGHIDIETLSAAHAGLAGELQALRGRTYRIASISLVEHSAKESLEAIVTHAFESTSGPAPLPFPGDKALQAHLDTFRYHLRRHHPDALDLFLQEHRLEENDLFSSSHLSDLDQLAREVRFLFRPDPGRNARFEHVFDEMSRQGCSGVVLLVDELSEFLHSKTGATLAEDVRFLQFLGETSAERPLFILAALQEYLEAAEYGLPGEIVRKIKDRYPHNLELTTTHVEEIITRRLIRHKPGSSAAIEAVYRRLKTYLKDFPVPAARFLRAYPIHPATTLLLDRLKPLLSRSRGIVDFIHFRLRGSADRGIPGLLDASSDTLLTPDAIFDHFRLRIRENIEIAAYDTTVYEYYTRALDVIFSDPEHRALADRIVKMLILLEISPEPKPYSVRTLTHALLVRVSRVDPDANFLQVRDILEKLVSQGAYIHRLPARSEGSSSFDDVYRISLKADLNLVLNRKIQAAVLSLGDAPDLRIFEALAPTLELESLPLNRFIGSSSQIFSIQWQRTSREGRVSVGALTQLDVPRLVDTLDELQEKESDWAVFIGVPYDVEAQRQHLHEALLPALRRAGEAVARSVLFWLPQPIGFHGPEGDFLRETLARRAVLSREQQEAGTSQAENIMALLAKGIESDNARIETIFHQAYYQGGLESVAGKEENISNLGRPFFEQTLLAVLTPVLSARFPDHGLCAPLGRLPTLDDLEAIVDRLYRTGAYQPRRGETDILATRIVSLLRPLGLVKKSGSALTLSVETGRPGPIRAFLELVDKTPRSLKEIERIMRKGSFGMAHPMFQLMTLGLAYGGVIACYGNERRRDVSQLSALNFDQIEAVSLSDLTQLDLSPLAELPMVPENMLTKGELTFHKQERLWLALKDARGQLQANIDDVKEGLSRATAYRAIPFINRDEIQRDIETMEGLISTISPAAGARDGIEGLVKALKQWGGVRELCERTQCTALFFRDHFAQLLLIQRYVERLSQLPEGLEYAELRQHLEELRENMRESSLVTSAPKIEMAEASFKRFQTTYTETYRKAHARWKGPARFHAYEVLRSSSHYRLLGHLAGISSLAADDRKSLMDRRLTSVFETRCQQLGEEDLLSSPICTCGYRLGETPPLPPPSELEALLNDAIESYLAALAGPRHLNALQKAANELNETGRTDAAARIRALVQHLEPLDANTTPPKALKSSMVDKLEPIFSNSFVRDIDNAILGVTSVEERDLEALVSQLKDRCLSEEAVRSIFQKWLGGMGGTSGPMFFRFRG